MQTFFVSDTHFYHAKMADHRGFASVVDMNEALIEAWNQVVGHDDVVYHLGDLSFAGTPRTQEVIGRLNGRIKIVPGNHDNLSTLSRLHTRAWSTDGKPFYNPVEVLQPLARYKHSLPRGDGTSDVQRIILCHFPLCVWDQAHYGAWHLHGHSHGFLKDEGGRMLDVGVDGPQSYNFRPVSYARVAEYMALRSYVQRDQHGERK